jgi:DNA-binding NarL/FixJ family response regulator
MKASVLIAQPEPVVVLGLSHLINASEHLQVCGEAMTAADTRDLCLNRQVDVAVVDPELDGGGTSLLRDLVRWAPATRILVFARDSSPISVQRSLTAGALGYLTPREPLTEVTTAILRCLEGHRTLGTAVAQIFLERIAHGQLEIHGDGETTLSDRELQVYRLIGQGMPLREVAEELHISTKTVETHLHRMKLKLHLRDGLSLQKRAAHFCSQAPRS